MGRQEQGPQHIEPKHITFANEETRRSLEIHQRVQHLNATLPPLPIPKEGYKLTPISFDRRLRND